MIGISFSGTDSRALEVLCLGCHSDDIEIGCGGTILTLAQKYPGSVFHWVVFSANGVRETEAQHAANLFVRSSYLKGPLLKNFRDGFMPFVGGEVKSLFEELKTTSTPDLIFTHYRKDAHQDHRLISELTWNTFRNHLILEYEIPKYDGDLGHPNLFVPLESDVCEKKITYIMESFVSQRTRRWFREDTFRALMRIRGIECNSVSGYAEAFYCRKIVI